MSSGNKPKPLGRLSTFERCYDEWVNKRASGEVGIPNHEGLWMIIYSAFGRSDVNHLQTHAEALADKWRLQRAGGELIDICANPSRADVEDLVSSELVSTIAYLGHGSLGAVRHYNRAKWDNVAWYNFAAMSGPLKTGVFEQRTCALTGSDNQVRVPVGTFIMEEPSNVYAAVDHYFQNNDGFPEFDAAIHPAYQPGANSREELMRPLARS